MQQRGVLEDGSVVLRDVEFRGDRVGGLRDTNPVRMRITLELVHLG